MRLCPLSGALRLFVYASWAQYSQRFKAIFWLEHNSRTFGNQWAEHGKERVLVYSRMAALARQCKAQRHTRTIIGKSGGCAFLGHSAIDFHPSRIRAITSGSRISTFRRRSTWQHSSARPATSSFRQHRDIDCGGIWLCRVVPGLEETLGEPSAHHFCN